jgi:NADH/NAD ratio-sensing transcriptional regulator Rex
MDLEKLDKTINELDLSSKQLKGYTEIFNELTKLQISISENTESFKNNSRNLETINTAINESISEFHKLVKELDSSMVSRLERHKSDIQVEIRNEGTQIQRAFENSLNNGFNNLEHKIIERFKEFEKLVKSNKSVALFAIAIGVLNTALLVYLILR